LAVWSVFLESQVKMLILMYGEGWGSKDSIFSNKFYFSYSRIQLSCYSCISFSYSQIKSCNFLRSLASILTQRKVFLKIFECLRASKHGTIWLKDLTVFHVSISPTVCPLFIPLSLNFTQNSVMTTMLLWALLIVFTPVMISSWLSFVLSYKINQYTKQNKNK